MSIDEYDWTLWKIMPTVSKKLEKIFTLQYDIIKTSELNKGTSSNDLVTIHKLIFDAFLVNQVPVFTVSFCAFRMKLKVCYSF